MFRMNVTRLAAPDGMNVKTFVAGQEYKKSELSNEIFEVYKQRGDLTDLEPEVEPETERNVLPTVEDLHKAKNKGGGK